MVRPFTVLACEQRSDEWKAARAGLATGSRAKDILASIQKGEAAARRDYRMQLVAERLTGRPQESDYINAEMQRGIDCEPLARGAYEAITGAVVRESGFLRSTAHAAGASLDGHLGDFQTVVSLKCPKTSTHLGYLEAGIMPAAYVPQMLHELWLTGAERYDFLSWDDRLPEGLSTFLTTVHRSAVADEIRAYEGKLLAFLAEVAEAEAKWAARLKVTA